MECQTLDFNAKEVEKFVRENNGPSKMCHQKVSKVEEYFILTIYKSCQIRIYKPLFLLKLSLLLWFSAAASIMPFYNIFMKKRGLTIQDLYIIYAISPFLQFLCTAALGVLTDKFGKSKLIIILHLITSVLLLLTLSALPAITDANCNVKLLLFECQEHNLNGTDVERACKLNVNQSMTEPCMLDCSDLLTRPFCVNYDHYEQISIAPKHNFSVLLNESSETASFCQSESRTHCLSPFCHQNLSGICQISCTERISGTCLPGTKNKPVLIFIYASIQTTFFMCYVTIYRFFDIAAMALVKKYNSSYGTLRVFSVLGAIIGPFLSTFIVHMATAYGEEANYKASFYLYSILSIITAVFVSKIEVQHNDTGKFAWKKMGNFITKPKILFFFIVLFIQGSTWGFQINFLNIYLESIKVEAYMIGLIAVLKNVYGLPILFISNWLMTKIGATNIFVLSLFSRAISCLGYSFLESAWVPLMLELTAIISYHLFWVTVMHYCSIVTPPGILASMNSVVGSIHFTIGRASGSLIGGMCMNAFGGPAAFLVMAGINVAFGVLYGLFQFTKYR